MGFSPLRALQTGFPALRHRNFRLFWLGQCVSLIGTWMQNIGQAWLVLELTNSALKLSMVRTIQFLPMTVFALVAGTLADRFPKRKVLLFTQISLAVLAAILGTLTYFDLVRYWHVLILAFLLGMVNTLDMPTRQSFFVEMVGKDDLMNAIALNSSIFNLARIAGPAVAGILIGLVGIGMCFYINAVSFIAVIIGLLLIRMPEKSMVKGKDEIARMMRQILPDIKEGLKYVVGNKVILRHLLLLAVFSVFVMNYSIFVPVFAQQTLGQNATGYGFLMTCMGVGSFTGAIALATRSQRGPNLKFIIAGALGTSLLLALLGLEKSYLIACVTLFAAGLSSIIFMTQTNSTIQLSAEDHVRGRVMSVYSLVFGGLLPVGSLYAGNLSERTGTSTAMIISGTLGILFVLLILFFFRKTLRTEKAPA